jgi:hypothetical protein
VFDRGSELFAGVAPASLAPRGQRDAVGDLVQPAGDCFAPGDSTGMTGQGEKGRLEGIFGVVRIVQRAQTYAEDQLRVPPEEQLKGRLIAVGGDAGEKLGVAGAAAHFRGHAANPAEDRCSFTLGHSERPQTVFSANIEVARRYPYPGIGKS